MRCIVLEQPHRFEMREIERPKAGPGEAFVRVRRIGICGTDLHAYQGNQPFFSYPRVLGHELAVEVVEVGENPQGLSRGDLCVVVPYLECGSCVACRQGKVNCCTQLRVLGVHVDGGMAEFLTVPVRNLIPSPNLNLEQIALVENQSIGAHAVRRAAPEEGEPALVIGAGPIGLGVIQAAKARGAMVIAMDISRERLEFCHRHLGVEHTVNAQDKALDALLEITSGDLPTLVFDATGSPESMLKAFEYVAHGGRLVFVGVVQADITFHDPEFHKREMTLLATRNATRQDFEWVVRSMESGAIVTDPMITHRVSFEQVIGSFDMWLKPESGLIKAVVEL